jgi:hypothetical protein
MKNQYILGLIAGASLMLALADLHKNKNPRQ